MSRAGAVAVLIVSVVLTIVAGCGTVERRMTITSEPPGALVFMNDQEIGRTPVKRDFTWYGVYDVQVRKEGYDTKFAHAKVIAPIWQWPPFDFFAELLPIHAVDRRTLHYSLHATTTLAADPDVMLSRAEQLRLKLQSSQYTRYPATIPVTQPATTQSTQPATTQTTQPATSESAPATTAPSTPPATTQSGKFL